MRCGRHTQQCLWLGPRRHIGSCWSAVTNAATVADSDKHGHAVRSGNTDAYTYSYGYGYGDCNSNAQCDSYSDSYRDCNANTDRNAERNTDSDTYCDSQRVAYGYAKGNAAAAWDAAAETESLISE
jgi:hypothetical protein